MKLRMLMITVTVIILWWFWSLFWSTQFLRSLKATVLFLKKQIKMYFKSPWVCRFYCVIGHSELASRCPAWPDLESPNAFSACPLLVSSAQTSPVITLQLLALAPPPRTVPSLLAEFRNSSKTFELAQSQLSNLHLLFRLHSSYQGLFNYETLVGIFWTWYGLLPWFRTWNSYGY